jgi:hypothetical protein
MSTTLGAFFDDVVSRAAIVWPGKSKSTWYGNPAAQAIGVAQADDRLGIVDLSIAEG